MEIIRSKANNVFNNFDVTNSHLQESIGNNSANKLPIYLQKLTKVGKKLITLEHTSIKVFERNATSKE